MTFSFAVAYPLTTNTPVLTTNTPGELMLPHAALAATPMHSGEMHATPLQLPQLHCLWPTTLCLWPAAGEKIPRQEALFVHMFLRWCAHQR